MKLKTLPLVDERIVEDTFLLRRAIEKPFLKKENPVIPHGQAYGSICREDGGSLRMYYTWYDKRIKSGGNVGGSCWLHLARSVDGLHWAHPNLGLFSKDGSTANNIVLGPDATDPEGRVLAGHLGPNGFCVLDAKQENLPHVRGRYTAIYLANLDETVRGICLAHSEDGLIWHAYPENPVISGWPDGTKPTFFDRRIGRYVMYPRPTVHAGPEAACRRIARCESEDLVHWTVPKVVLDTDEADGDGCEWWVEPEMARKGAQGRPDVAVPRGRIRQYQGLVAWPYHDLYLGLAYWFDVKPGTMELELVHSIDGSDWRREARRERFIELGPPGSPEAGMATFPMDNGPIEMGDETWIYYTGYPETHNADRYSFHPSILLRALQRDRWVGYEAEDHEGELLTVPIEWNGQGVAFNVRIESNGEVTMQIEDAEGRPLPGRERGNHLPLTGPLDSLNTPMVPREPMMSNPVNRPIRLRIFLKRAKLFAMMLGERC
ncbi:MAG: hypothetical protein HY360_08370 [Verrucomicrobia bacterium]|nr:hypothetical protein [Verrucomicrobiota bacterium]